MFQTVEYELRQIVWFCTDVADTTSRDREGGFGGTLRNAKRLVPEYIAQHRSEASELSDRFEEAFRRCTALKDERNRLVHSAYLQHESFPPGDQLTVAYSRRGRLDPQQGDISQRVDKTTFEAATREAEQIFEELFGLHKRIMHG
jgi:Fe-S cluster assembly scaffold protein SufB